MKHSFTRSIVFILFVLATSTAFTQTISNTMYFMGTLPQSYYLNPARQPFCNFYLGLPAMSPFQFSTSNSSFTYSDLFWNDKITDSVVTPFHSDAAMNDFLGRLKEAENMSIDLSSTLLSFGFRADKLYIGFDASLRLNGRMTYPTSFLNLLFVGNDNNQLFDLSQFSTEALLYSELSLNISRSFGDILFIGVRPKILYGLGTFATEDNSLSLQTSTSEWLLEGEATLHMALTGLDLPVNMEDGMGGLVNDYLDTLSTITPGNISRIINKNRGAGVDLGIIFKPIEKLELSASLLDLGYIRWSAGPQSVTLNGSYAFQGVNLNLIDSADFAANLIDSIGNSFGTTKSYDPFTTRLHPKILIAGRFFLTPGLDVGILSRTILYSNETDQDFILSANFHPKQNIFGYSISYSLLGKGHSAIGIGTSARVWIFNTYAIYEYYPFRFDLIKSQDIPMGGIPIPVGTYNHSFRIGANLVFGSNKTKHLKHDTPMFNSTNWMY